MGRGGQRGRRRFSHVLRARGSHIEPDWRDQPASSPRWSGRPIRITRGKGDDDRCACLRGRCGIVATRFPRLRSNRGRHGSARPGLAVEGQRASRAGVRNRIGGRGRLCLATDGRGLAVERDHPAGGAPVEFVVGAGRVVVGAVRLGEVTISATSEVRLVVSAVSKDFAGPRADQAIVAASAERGCAGGAGPGEAVQPLVTVVDRLTGAASSRLNAAYKRWRPSSAGVKVRRRDARRRPRAPGAAREATGPAASPRRQPLTPSDTPHHPPPKSKTPPRTHHGSAVAACDRRRAPIPKARAGLR